MFWVVQGNLYKEDGLSRLVHVLDRFDIAYTLVKPAPMTLKFMSHDYDTFKNDYRNAPEPYVDANQNIMVIGAYTLSKIAKDRGWVPGAFMNENFDFNVWVQQWGSENMLNGNAVVGKLSDIKVPHDRKFFARPVQDTKSFSGMIFEPDNFQHWRTKVIENEKKDNKSTLKGDTEIMVAPLQHIHREYRFFVIDGNIITGSMYKLHNQVIYTDNIDPEILAYAKDMVSRFQPDRGFVIDIAMTDNGCKIVEINGLNSAGFYASDISKIVMAVEDMNFPSPKQKNKM